MDIEPTELAGIERLDAVLFARGFSVTSATVLYSIPAAEWPRVKVHLQSRYA
ncbi:MAG: hypothetical protein ACLQVD_12930 [Capsulimonadaceae bacterium]